jgi:drug/metabolite transporter (DMT)-like permease
MRWGVTRTALVGYAAPFVGAAVGATLLNERLGAAAFVGLALTTISLVWVNRGSSELAARGSSGAVGAVTGGTANTRGGRT